MERTYKVNQGLVIEGDDFRADVFVVDIDKESYGGYRKARIKIENGNGLREDLFNPEKDISIGRGASFRIVHGRSKGREIKIRLSNLPNGCTIRDYRL